MKEHRRDLVTGTVLLVLAVIYLGLTKGIRAFTGDGATPITAKTMPQIWGVIMLLCAAGRIVRSLIRIRKATAAGEKRTPGDGLAGWLKHNYAVVGTFLALAVYSAAMKPAGYLISTMVYLLVQIPLLTPKEKRKDPKMWIITVVLAVVFALVTDYMFVKLFSVRLPKGLIGFK